MREFPNLNRLCSSAGLALSLLILPAGDASAQIPKDEWKCISVLNQAGRKVAIAQAKQLQGCIREYLKGGQSADACAPTDPKGKIGKAEQRTATLFQKKCSSSADFGPQDPNEVNAAAREKEFELYARVFGSSLDDLTTQAQDIVESKCIQILSKAIAKCQDAKVSEFLKCKKIGLKDNVDPIESAAELEDRCLGVGASPQPDPAGRVFKKCQDPDRGFIFKSMQKKCVDKQVDLVSAFGKGVCAAEAALDGAALASCMEREVECAFCLWANATDALARDCDLFDNGSVDGSCGCVCGDQIRCAIEECDGSDDAACPDSCQPDCSCPILSCPDCCSPALDLLSFTTTLATASAGTLRSFRCSNDRSTACVDSRDCRFGGCWQPGDPNDVSICRKNFSIECITDADCVGICEEQSDGLLPLDLGASGLYLGHGQAYARRPQSVPNRGQFFTKVTGCDSATDELTLSPTTPLEVGERHCTTGRKCSVSRASCVLDSDCPVSESCETQCLFGPLLPLPGPDDSISFIDSVCVVNHLAEDVSGSAQCDGGGSELSIPLRSVVYWAADLFASNSPPDIPGVQPCPLCDTLCQGGSKDRFPCVDDSDCPDGTCGTSPECLGGPNDGNPCTPETSGSAELGDGYPTSHDCPPEPDAEITADIGGLPLPFSLTAGSLSWNAFDHPEGKRNFVGFCRDGLSVGTGCFEGDPDCGGDGSAVPCSHDSDCDDGDEFESCMQRDPGAFGLAAATRIEVSGSADGQCLDDAQPHAATLVGLFPVPPTFFIVWLGPLVAVPDNLYGLPGPAAALLQVEQQLQ